VGRDNDLALRLVTLARADASSLEGFSKLDWPEWAIYQRRLEVGLDRLPQLSAARRHSMGHCLEQIEVALHPRTRWVWLLLLIQGHGERAIAGLIGLLAHRDSEVRQASAWALGQLGRCIMPDLRERYQSATTPWVRQAICQALWFLGPQARGAESWPLAPSCDWSRAVLYRLQGRGWPIMLQARQLPLYLDDACLAALGQLAYSLVLEDRLYAICALAGRWGPARTRSQLLLQALATDSDSQIAVAALSALRLLKVEPRTEVLREALLSHHEELIALGIELFLGGDFHSVLGSLREEPTVHQTFLIQRLSSWDDPWRLRILQRLADRPLFDLSQLTNLMPLMTDPNPQIRLALVPAWLALGGLPKDLTPMLADLDPEVAGLVAQVLHSNGLSSLLLDHLDSPAVLEFVKSHYLVAEFVLDRRPGLDKLISALQTQARSGPEPVRRLSQQILDQMSLSHVRWEKWPKMNRTQRQFAARLIEIHQCFPDELQAMVEAGEVDDDLAFSLSLRFHIPLRSDILQQMVTQQGGLGNDDLRAALLVADRAGWDLLWQMVQGPPQEALAAIGELRWWVATGGGQDWLRQQGLSVLSLPVHPAVARALDSALAQALLGLNRALEDWKSEWALELATRPSSALLALHYLQRVSIPPERLEAALLSALSHPQVEVRMQAITMLKRTCLDFPTLVRQLPADPDPQLRLRILSLLHSRWGLLGPEVEELRQLVDHPAMASEAGKLLQRILGRA